MARFNHSWAKARNRAPRCRNCGLLSKVQQWGKHPVLSATYFSFDGKTWSLTNPSCLGPIYEVCW